MLNILIVEDNFVEMEYCCAAVNQILDENQFFKAMNAEEALQLMDMNLIDLFLIDLGLPGISGLALAEKIRSHKNYLLTPIILITGYQINELDIHRKYHYYEYIQKPYTFKILAEVIGPLVKALEKHKDEFVELTRRAESKMIYIEGKHEMCYINSKRIFFAVAIKRNLEIHTDIDTITDVRTIRRFLSDAQCEDFLRCHKSFAVNVGRIKKIQQVDRRLWHAYFNEDESNYCEISETYSSKIFSRFRSLSEDEE